MRKYLCLFISLALCGQMVQARDLFFARENISDVVYEAKALPQLEKWCGENFYQHFNFDVMRMRSNHPEIDAVVNQNIPTREELGALVNQKIQEILDFVRDEKIEPSEVEDNIMLCGRELTIQPYYLGHYQDKEQFAVEHYEYNGGAHGVAYTQYYVLDKNNKALKAKDLIRPEFIPELQSALLEQYLQFKNVKSVEEYRLNDECCIDTELDKDLSQSMKKALLTDNVYFNEQGLNFVYTPYEVAPYSDGEVVLTLPYERINPWLQER